MLFDFSPRREDLRAEANSAYQAEWYSKNRSAVLANQKARYVKNRERIAAYKKEYYERNKKEIAAKRAAWYAENSDAAKKASFAYYIKNYRNSLIVAARRRAKRGGREFNITAECVEWNIYCPCCGVELRYGGDGPAINAASLDRINNSEGYIKDNVWVICHRCNTLKNNGTAAEHRRIADAVDAAIAARKATNNV